MVDFGDVVHLNATAIRSGQCPWLERHHHRTSIFLQEIGVAAPIIAPYIDPKCAY